MDSAMDHLGQQAEARRVVMEQGQHHEEPAHQLRGERRQRPETDFGIELFFEFPGFRLVEFHCGHETSPYASARVFT